MGTLLSWVVPIAVLAAIALPFVVRALPAVRRAYQTSRSPRSSAEATVIGKRTEIAAPNGAATAQRYFVTFQFPDGDRVELGVDGSDSGMLAVGDQGTLHWQGPRFHSFAREVLR